jgi:hypothetical protein
MTRPVQHHRWAAEDSHRCWYFGIEIVRRTVSVEFAGTFDYNVLLKGMVVWEGKNRLVDAPYCVVDGYFSLILQIDASTIQSSRMLITKSKYTGFESMANMD